MPITDLSGTQWRANCLTITTYDDFPDPNEEDSSPFVNVIDDAETEQPDDDVVVDSPRTEPGLYVYYNDPEAGYEYVFNDEIPFPDFPDDDTVNPPICGIYTYIVDENNGTILLTFNDNLTLGYDYSTGNITWLEANATQIVEPQPTDTNKISVGTLKLAKAFIGNSDIASMWLGNVKIYEKR